ncbi:pirin family protein [Desulfovibrio sp. OttesenSCG-928-C06]|nr:pirin family protein [Desulfovibrio sp. OttesenSCG-928-C06]
MPTTNIESEARKVARTVTGTKTVDGAGVNLVRVLGYRTTRDFDPFLMLDAFDSENPDDYIRGFPMHPHRGIETVTYLISGEIEHEDSLGNSGRITDGSCQWMTAGSGILHQEMPKESARMLGLQLWINLPARKKMVYPKYNGLEAKDIPVIDEDGARIRILSGMYKDTKGAMQAEYVQATYLDVELMPGQSWSVETNPEDTVFAYPLLGSLSCEQGQPSLEARQAILFTQGYSIDFKAGPDGARFVLLSAPRLNEPVAWGGPIVMNTEEQLRDAFMELELNSFIKHNAGGGSV